MTMPTVHDSALGPLAFIHVASGADAIESPFAGSAFAVLVWAFVDMSDDDRRRVAETLVAAGTRYAVCGGRACAELETAIDWAHIASDPDFDPPDDTLVLTTSHEGEPVAEVAFFFANCVVINGEFECSRLVVSVGGSPDDARRLEEAVTREIEEWA